LPNFLGNWLGSSHTDDSTIELIRGDPHIVGINAAVIAIKCLTWVKAIPYSEALAIKICERIAVGELLLDICEDAHLPTMRRCNQWLKENSDFAALYKESINDRLSVFEEQVIKIADDMKSDWRTIVKNGKERRIVDPDVIMRSKLRIEVRFRHLKALRPERWGETSTLITKSGDDISDMPLAEIEKKLAELDRKENVVNEDRRSVA
jgi:hypothetical protein